MTKAIPRSLARIWQPCVFLATLVKVNPVGVEPGPAGRSKEDTAVLQSAATSDKLDRRIDPEFLHCIAYNRWRICSENTNYDAALTNEEFFNVESPLD